MRSQYREVSMSNFESAINGLAVLLLIIISMVFSEGSLEIRRAICGEPLTLESEVIWEAKMKMGPYRDYDLDGLKLFVIVDGKRLRLHYRGEVYE